jgi:hypothetical protein
MQDLSLKEARSGEVADLRLCRSYSVVIETGYFLRKKNGQSGISAGVEDLWDGDVAPKHKVP